jgi:hypothetical protein
MTIDELFNNVEDHEDLEGVGIDLENGVFHIRSISSGYCTRIPVGVAEFDDLSWDKLEPVLTGEQEPVSLYYLTRVVGYYSRVDNWNESKIGELQDRRAGDYKVA